MTQPHDAHRTRLEKLADLALSAPLEDRARLEHTIRLICRARMAIEHSSPVVEQAEHQLERLEARTAAPTRPCGADGADAQDSRPPA